MCASRRLLVFIAVLLGVSGGVGAAVPDSIVDRPALRKIHPSLRVPGGGPANVLIRMTDRPLVARLGRNAKQWGPRLGKDEQVAVARELLAGQDEVVRQLRAAGGTVVGRLVASQNAVLAVVDTGVLERISELRSVQAIRPVVNSRLALVDTVPQIGAAVVQTGGVTGEGVRVAVLDSGVDYTHANLGGPGTPQAFRAAYGDGTADPANRTRDGLFPTAKVVGGWDFVGEKWPFGEDGGIEPDEDPIDIGGHGTHVADILAGVRADGTHRGVAPGATLYAFKVCSAVASDCNGFATLLALDACLHPDSPELSLDAADDGTLLRLVENPVDIINLSLGTGYGMMQDDKAYVVQLLSDFGITVVAAAGNQGDLPYVVDSPGIAPGAISVAETRTAGARIHPIRLVATSNRGGVAALLTSANTADNAWAPVDRDVDGVGVVLGRGCAGDTYPVEDAAIAGRVAVVERGDCDVSEKVDRAARAGAVAVVVVNNVPGDPPGFSRGAGSVFVPTLVVSQADGATLRTLLERSPRARILFGPSQSIEAAGSMVGASSRGPSYTFHAIKPELGAPGASVSAVAGTGSGMAAFSGTSGATPMVAGAAALLQSVSLAESGLYWSPWAVKALLMNSADPSVVLHPGGRPVLPAPVSRVGAGQVRVDRALAAQAFAVVVDPPIEPGAPYDIQPALAFGYQAVTAAGPRVFTKQVLVVNLAPESRTFVVQAGFRYPDDAAGGAVTLGVSPPVLAVPAQGDGLVTVTLEVRPERLPDWTLGGGEEGGNGDLLRRLEFDGHLVIRDSRDTLSLPWHLLPRKAADLAVGAGSVQAGGNLVLANLDGATPGVSEVFALGGTSAVDYPKPDAFGFDEAWPDLKAAGVRAAGGALEFALAFHHEWTHPITPVGCLIYVDADLDGWEDLEFVTTEGDRPGLAVTEVTDLSTGGLIGVYPLDADLNASTLIVRVPLADLGLGADSTVDWYVVAADNYFTGNLTDIIYDETYYFLRHNLGQPRFSLAGAPRLIVPVGGAFNLGVAEVPGGAAASPSQEGFLLVHRQAVPGRGSDVVTVSGSVAASAP
jgi:subtilisin family serine protease